MSQSIILLNITLILSIIISSTVAFFTWQRRKLVSAWPFFWLIILITIWSLILLFQINAVGFRLKFFWEKVGYIDNALIPVAWLLFTYQYTNPREHLPKWLLIGLSLHPIISFVLIWVLGRNDLIWHSIMLDESQTFLTSEFASWTQASFIYTNFLILIGFFFLVKMFVRTPRFFSRQVISLLGALVWPWLTTALYIFKVFPLFNPTPITISFSGLILFWGFFKTRLFDIVPIARASVIESLQIGVIVLDMQNRIVDINPAAQSLIYQPQQDLIGRPLNSVFESGYSLLLKWIEQPFTQENLTFFQGVSVYYYACELANLVDSRGEINGRIFTLNNVTKRNQAETSLRHYTQRLQFLYDSGQAILSAQEPEQVASVTLEHIRKLIPCQLATVVLFSFDTEYTFLLAINPTSKMVMNESRKRPLNDVSGLSQLKSGQIAQIDVADDHPDIQIVRQYTEQNIRLIVKVPLFTTNQLIGSLNIFLGSFDTLNEEHIVILREVSITLAVALQQANLFAKEKNQRELAQTFYEIGQALTKSLDLTQVLEIILDELARVIHYDNASIMLLDDHILKNAAHRTIHQGKQSLKAFNINEFQHIKEVIVTQSPVIISNTKNDPRWKTLPTTATIHSWLGVPLIQNDQIIGILNITKAEENFFHHTDAYTANMLATQAVAAIRNAQLFESEHQTRKQEEILRAANVALTENLELDKILNKILEFLSQLVNYDSASVMLIDDNQEVFIYALRGYENWTNASQAKAFGFHLRDTPNLFQIFEQKRGFIIPDINQFEGWAHRDYSKHIKNWMGIPLIFRGEVIGFFSLDKNQPHYFTKTNLQAANALAAQAAIAIQNAKLFQETQQKTIELEAVARLSNSLHHTNDINKMVNIILREATAVINHSRGSIYLTDEKNHTLSLNASFPQDSHLDFTRYIHVDQETMGQVAQNRKTIIFTHISTLSSASSNKKIEEKTGSFKTMCLPLSTQELTVGILNITVSNIHTFTESEKQLLQAFAEIGGSAIHRVLVLDTLEQRVNERTQELAQANVRLLELDKLKSKFVADVSHELRTPVTNLRLYLDLFDRVSPEKQKQYLAVLKRQSIRLANLIEDILTLSKLEANKQINKSDNVALNDLIEQVVESLITHNNQPNFQIELNLTPQLPTFRASNNQIIQILTNLLSNAINYSNEGIISIKTSWAPLEQVVALHIQDYGQGIDAEDLPYIFDRFYRGKKAGQSAIPGTGLGLAIVKEIVDSYNGKITVQSDVNNGTLFMVQFPL